MSQPKNIVVPNLGDFAEVEVIEVLVNKGDTVDLEQSLITLETDKAAMEVPSPFAGVVLSVEVKLGDRVSTGDLVVVVAVEETSASPTAPEPTAEVASPETGAAPAPPPEPRTPPPKPAPPPKQDRHRAVLASPSVRRFARELGVDLADVSGSARRGRVNKDDVKAHVKKRMQSGGPAGTALPQVPVVDFSRFGPVEVKPLTRIQKIAGPRLHAAWVNIPHVTQHDEADITNLEIVRKALKSDAKRLGAKLTPLSFLIRAVAQTLGEFPRFNASLDPSGKNIVYKKYCHIGFAVDTPGGLVVPVIQNADQKSLVEIALLLGQLGEKARAGRLTSSNLQGGTFTISSLGSIGGTAFTPVINAPEVAILGVARSAIKPIWDGVAFQPRTILPLSLSYDHRVIDGAAAVRFTRHLAGVLETVNALVL
jgi:pyruvate dehydrogenase E2 component (dihydrolipoamide acetyltransferase)